MRLSLFIKISRDRNLLFLSRHVILASLYLVYALKKKEGTFLVSK